MRDHTSLIAWQEAEAVSLAVIDLSMRFWKPYARAVFDQLQRSALSVQLNIAEGYAFTNSPTFRRHLGCAYGSAIETGDLLRTLHKARIVPSEIVEPITTRCQRSQRLLLGLLRRSRATG